jgi:hypothetical protein
MIHSFSPAFHAEKRFLSSLLQQQRERVSFERSIKRLLPLLLQ